MPEPSDPGLVVTSDLVPLFVITGGRTLPPEHEYEHTAMVTSAQGSEAALRALTPEARTVMDLVTDGFLSVAEVAGHTQLPVGVVRILLAQLAEVGLLVVRKPVPAAEQVDMDVVSAVLTGLQKKFGA
ncbi:DUF742 domain-containing protein [Streptomyces sp. NPDC059897]|uniref:DUF742 domain-containing protein n=1 Tax=Streptomyces sp. NPDC059897 TaxID=3346994 RepID=UPI00364E74F0